MKKFRLIGLLLVVVVGFNICCAAEVDVYYIDIVDIPVDSLSSTVRPPNQKQTHAQGLGLAQTQRRPVQTQQNVRPRPFVQTQVRPTVQQQRPAPQRRPAAHPQSQPQKQPPRQQQVQRRPAQQQQQQQVQRIPSQQQQQGQRIPSQQQQQKQQVQRQPAQQQQHVQRIPSQQQQQQGQRIPSQQQQQQVQRQPAQQQQQQVQRQPAQQQQQQVQRVPAQQQQQVQRVPAQQQQQQGPQQQNIIVTQQPQRQPQQQSQNIQRQPTMIAMQQPAQHQQTVQQPTTIATQQPQKQRPPQRPQQHASIITFPGNTNKAPSFVNQNSGSSKPNNAILTPTTPANSQVQPTDNTDNSAIGTDGLGQATTIKTATSPTSGNGNGDFVSSNGANGNVNQNTESSNGLDVNNFNNGAGQFTGGFNAINNNAIGGNGFNNFGGDRGENAGYNWWFGPHRPQANHYRDFAGIFNAIDQKAETDYNTSAEEDELMDDFNGRSVVAPGQYPHMAALGYRTSGGETEFNCGGSLISEMFVLTAAHCCFLNGQAPHLVKIGEIKLKESENYLIPQQRGIARVIKHPYYNESMYYNDIGLLELANPIVFTYFVRPIRLWATDDIPYEKVFTMGYGSTSFAQAQTNVLTELDLSIVPLEICNRTMPVDKSAPYGIMESQICAKDFEQNRDTCQGDSGGPLQLNLERPRLRRMRYYLVGVISYGIFCRSEQPGVYTRVSSYIDWIASEVWPDYFNNFQGGIPA